MPTNETMQWTFPEYDTPHRNTWWYVVAGLVVGLLLVWSIAEQNYSFPLIIIMVTIILFAHTLQTPSILTCRISSDGIQIGENTYPFSDLESFWIISTEAGDVLYVQMRRGMRRIIKIPLRNQSTSRVRQILSKYVEENGEYSHEPLGDWLSRTLRL